MQWFMPFLSSKLLPSLVVGLSFMQETTQAFMDNVPKRAAPLNCLTQVMKSLFTTRSCPKFSCNAFCHLQGHRTWVFHHFQTNCSQWSCSSSCSAVSLDFVSVWNCFAIVFCDSVFDCLCARCVCMINCIPSFFQLRSETKFKPWTVIANKIQTVDCRCL